VAAADADGQQGGQDSQLVANNLSARLDTSCPLEMSDARPAYIAVRTWGWRAGLRDVLRRLLDPALADRVTWAGYSFRLFVSMMTGDARYNHTNTKMWVTSGVWMGTRVVNDAYLV